MAAARRHREELLLQLKQAQEQARANQEKFLALRIENERLHDVVYKYEQSGTGRPGLIGDLRTASPSASPARSRQSSRPPSGLNSPRKLSPRPRAAHSPTPVRKSSESPSPNRELLVQELEELKLELREQRARAPLSNSDRLVQELEQSNQNIEYKLELSEQRARAPLSNSDRLVQDLEQSNRNIEYKLELSEQAVRDYELQAQSKAKSKLETEKLRKIEVEKLREELWEQKASLERAAQNEARRTNFDQAAGERLAKSEQGSANAEQKLAEALEEIRCLRNARATDAQGYEARLRDLEAHPRKLELKLAQTQKATASQQAQIKQEEQAMRRQRDAHEGRVTELTAALEGSKKAAQRKAAASEREERALAASMQSRHSFAITELKAEHAQQTQALGQREKRKNSKVKDDESKKYAELCEWHARTESSLESAWFEIDGLRATKSALLREAEQHEDAANEAGVVLMECQEDFGRKGMLHDETREMLGHEQELHDGAQSQLQNLEEELCEREWLHHEQYERQKQLLASVQTKLHEEEAQHQSSRQDLEQFERSFRLLDAEHRDLANQLQTKQFEIKMLMQQMESRGDEISAAKEALIQTSDSLAESAASHCSFREMRADKQRRDTAPTRTRSVSPDVMLGIQACDSLRNILRRLSDKTIDSDARNGDRSPRARRRDPLPVPVTVVSPRFPKVVRCETRVPQIMELFLSPVTSNGTTQGLSNGASAGSSLQRARSATVPVGYDDRGRAPERPCWRDVRGQSLPAAQSNLVWSSPSTPYQSTPRMPRLEVRSRSAGHTVQAPFAPVALPTAPVPGTAVSRAMSWHAHGKHSRTRSRPSSSHSSPGATSRDTVMTALPHLIAPGPLTPLRFTSAYSCPVSGVCTPVAPIPPPWLSSRSATQTAVSNPPNPMNQPTLMNPPGYAPSRVLQEMRRRGWTSLRTSGGPNDLRR